MTGPTTLWKTWKVDEEGSKILGQSNFHHDCDAKMLVHAGVRPPPATLGLSFRNNTIPPVPEVCNTTVT